MSANLQAGDIAEVVLGILDASDEKNVQAFQHLAREPKVLAAVAAVRDCNPGDFYFTLGTTLGDFVDGLLMAELPQSPEGRFLFKHAAFVEAHLRERVERVDGFGCCADKSRFLMRGLARFYRDGTPLVFDRSQKYTFHLPVHVLCSHEEVVSFFLALRQLYYGRYEAFVSALEPR